MLHGLFSRSKVFFLAEQEPVALGHLCSFELVDVVAILESKDTAAVVGFTTSTHLIWTTYMQRSLLRNTPQKKSIATHHEQTFAGNRDRVRQSTGKLMYRKETARVQTHSTDP